MSNETSLSNLGWQAFFQQQLSLSEWEQLQPARIIEQHRNELIALGEQGLSTLPLLHSMPEMVVGDWVLLDAAQQFVRLLERNSCFVRKAAGSKRALQLISANINTAFIVTSVNQDFNLNRLERFLALVHEADCDAVVLLSKSDLVDSTHEYERAVRKLDPLLMVEAINATCADSVAVLQPWLKAGETIAVLGSSGVGKSTLINTLLAQEQQSTAAIREDDSKGRHTTTSRALLALPNGGMILDTPGMRELQLSDCDAGIASTFADIEALAQQCRFSDCHHDTEPGCAIQAALHAGQLEPRRLQNYLKLQRENQLNSASLAERRQQDRDFGKMIKRVQQESKSLKGH